MKGLFQILGYSKHSLGLKVRRCFPLRGYRFRDSSGTIRHGWTACAAVNRIIKRLTVHLKRDNPPQRQQPPPLSNKYTPKIAQPGQHMPRTKEKRRIVRRGGRVNADPYPPHASPQNRPQRRKASGRYATPPTQRKAPAQAVRGKCHNYLLFFMISANKTNGAISKHNHNIYAPSFSLWINTA